MAAYQLKGKIIIGTGCFCGAIEDFETAVKNTHGENEHAKQYSTALKYVRERFSK